MQHLAHQEDLDDVHHAAEQHEHAEQQQRRPQQRLAPDDRQAAAHPLTRGPCHRDAPRGREQQRRDEHRDECAGVDEQRDPRAVQTGQQPGERRRGDARHRHHRLGQPQRPGQPVRLDQRGDERLPGGGGEGLPGPEQRDQHADERLAGDEGEHQAEQGLAAARHDQQRAVRVAVDQPPDHAAQQQHRRQVGHQQRGDGERPCALGLQPQHQADGGGQIAEVGDRLRADDETEVVTS